MRPLWDEIACVVWAGIWDESNRDESRREVTEDDKTLRLMQPSLDVVCWTLETPTRSD